MMRPSVRGALVLAVVLAVALGAAGAPRARTIRWLSDFDKGRAEAKKARRVMMVDFYADW